MSRPTREALLRAFECYAYERRAGSDLGAENALRVGGRVYDALETAEGDLAEARRLLTLTEAVVSAALDLRTSGYDGPWTGDVCEPLYSTLAAWERYYEGSE